MNQLIKQDTISVDEFNSKFKLTPRQQQVLKLVCHRGLSNKSIAGILKISESTVKIHISSILKEYGVRNRTQLVLAFNQNLRA
jgi:DNA-binding NarL/FixJ family response regulator